MTGETGQFIRGIPLTMISALVGSLLVAIFVSPLLSHRFLKAEDGAKERKEGRTIRLYAALLRRTLDHKLGFLLLAAIAFVSSVLFIPRLGLQFFPKAEKKWFLIEVTLPPGSNFDATSAMARDIEKILMGRQEVESTMVHIGEVGPRVYYNINFFRVKSQNRAQFFVHLKGDRKDLRADTVIRSLRPELSGLPGARIELKELEQGPPVGRPGGRQVQGGRSRCPEAAGGGVPLRAGGHPRRRGCLR